MLKQQKNNKILLLLSVCIMLTMLLQVAYAADHTINITQQPASSLTGVTGESPGTISVEATTTNGAPITYQWWCILESGTSHTVGTDANTFKISSDLVPGTYEYYCDLKAEGCDAIESEKTTVTVNKATYTGIQSDTFYVKADQSTLNNEYILPNVPMSDMTYTIEDNGGNLVTGTGELKRDASTDWRWILIFNTASKPAGTEEDIILKINGGYCYNDSSFTLTVKAGKLPVSITGIDGTDAEYSGNPQKGYTGEPQTGGFTGALNHHYNGRNTTVYDSGTAPTDAGDYTVTLSIPEDADYSGSKTIDFSIKKKEVKVWLVNYVMVQGEELPTSDSIYVNYIGFVAGDNSDNSISTWAVPKLNVSDSNTPGVSDIDFETEATLVTEKEKHYTLKHEKGELTIQAAYYVTVNESYAPTSGAGRYILNWSVNIDAGARDGYTFVNWTSPDGVSFANPGSASTTFIMPGKDVTVTANWQQVAPTKYTVTFNANGGSVSPASAQTGTDGKLTVLPTPSRSNHRFDGWFTAVSGGTQITTDYVFTNNTTIYAHWTYTSGSGGGGGSSSGSTAQPAAPAADGAVKVNYTSANGTAVLSLPAAKVNDIIENSQGGAAVIDLSKVSGITAAELPKAALSAMNEAGLDITLKLPAGTIALDEDAAASILEQATGSNLSIELQPVATGSLTPAQQEAVQSGDLVLDINILSGTQKISSFDGTLSIQVAYNGPQPVAVWYLNDKGDLEKVNCTFKDGIVSFDLDHLSLYVVGQDTKEAAQENPITNVQEAGWKNPFSDVLPGAWYYDAVSFIAAKGITSGTTATTFSPDATLTRGQFITMLMRAYGMSPDDNPADNFVDAGNTYYTGYLAAAKRLGITKGIGDNQFAPEQAITRQDMFTLLYNVLKGINQLPAGNLGKTLNDFTDSGSIPAYAREAMAHLVKTGIVSGSSGKLTPAETTTRAQMIQVLYNLIS